MNSSRLGASRPASNSEMTSTVDIGRTQRPSPPVEHSQMPQGRGASQVTAFADQPIGVTSGSKDSNRECSPRARADGSLGTTSRAYLTEYDTHRTDLSILR